jgi:hypothetical protein
MNTTTFKIKTRKKNHTFKNKLMNFFCANKFRLEKTIMEDGFNIKQIINNIIENYKKISEFNGEKNEYLGYIDNDLSKFLIGYYIDLKNTNDKEGIKMYNMLQKKIYINNIVIESKLIQLLNDMPIYLLLSFSGYALYLYKDIEMRNKKMI